MATSSASEELFSLPAGPPGRRAALYRWATILALFTVFYNVAEGLVSVFFGIEDETLALFGFGLDSFVEVLSGVGIWHMLRRMRRSEPSAHDAFERTALRVTGTAFFLLAGGLIVTAVISLAQGRAPEATFWGVVVATVSILTMGVLIRLKISVGRKLGSAAIIADANCTRACLAMSVVLLLSSIGYEVTGLGHLDAAGAICIALLSIREGREAFGKARGEACCCSGCASPPAEGRPAERPGSGP